MRRLLVPVILVLVSVSSAVAGVRAVPPAEAGEARAVPLISVPPEAPVLTPRRLPALLAQPIGTARLVQSLDALAAASPGRECLLVSQGDRILYDQNSNEALAPASGMKLLTAAAVLARFDSEERLRTSVVAAPAPTGGGIVEGDLWLVGGGDPVLGTAPWAADFIRQPALFTPLEELADGVVAAGVSEVRGRVVGDESRYDQVRYVLTWPERYILDNEIGPLTALSVNDGFLEWDPLDVPYADPAVGAAGVLTDLLRQRGVVVAGDPAAGPAPASAAPIAAIDSPPMADLVSQMLRESDNGTAELLVKELGRQVGGEGSTAAGRVAVSSTLASLGLPTEGLVVADGSGLDPSNRVTCGLLHEVLEATDDGDALDRGLAVAGATGTLARRFVGTPVSGQLRGKTGSIRGVASLSGYVATKDGGELTFSSIQNEIDRFDDGLPFQDSLGAVLADYPALPTLEEIGPEGYPDAA
ncbi:D-alanyl-D-alanine carboxypeptidase/D-alanyl-D-alanine-endopeptidase [soil metagenome]